MMNLTDNIQIERVMDPSDGAAGTSDINSDSVDMQNFGGVKFEVTFGTITGSAVTSIKAQQDSVTGMGSAADLKGTGQTVADTDDEKIFYIDIAKPKKRFVRCVVDRGTQNAVVQSITANLYDPRKAPTSHGTNVSGELHVSPEEGTA
jgi:hypothetical protein